MEEEKQVARLNICKKLHDDFGMGQNMSKFSWLVDPSGKTEPYVSIAWLDVEPGTRTYPAFTVAELGMLLPPLTRSWQYGLNKDKKGNWTCELFMESSKEINEDTEANARGEMLIYLLENNKLNFK